MLNKMTPNVLTKSSKEIDNFFLKSFVLKYVRRQILQIKTTNS